MAGPAERGSAAARFMRLKLPRPFWWKTVTEETGAPTTPAEGLQPQAEIGAMLRRRREELGLSLRDLANEHLSVPTDKGANAGLKVASLVGGMVAVVEAL